MAVPYGRVPARIRLDQADRLHPLIPHGTARWKALYRQRTSVERDFGRAEATTPAAAGAATPQSDCDAPTTLYRASCCQRPGT